MINFKAFKKKTCSNFSKVAYVGYLQNCIRYYAFCYYHCKLFGFHKTVICRARLFPNQGKHILYYYTTIPIYGRSYTLIDWYCSFNLGWK